MRRRRATLNRVTAGVLPLSQLLLLPLRTEEGGQEEEILVLVEGKGSSELHGCCPKRARATPKLVLLRFESPSLRACHLQVAAEGLGVISAARRRPQKNQRGVVSVCQQAVPNACSNLMESMVCVPQCIHVACPACCPPSVTHIHGCTTSHPECTTLPLARPLRRVFPSCRSLSLRAPTASVRAAPTPNTGRCRLSLLARPARAVRG